MDNSKGAQILYSPLRVNPQARGSPSRYHVKKKETRRHTMNLVFKQWQSYSIYRGENI